MACRAVIEEEVEGLAGAYSLLITGATNGPVHSLDREDQHD